MDPRAIIDWLEGLVDRFGRRDCRDLCVAYVRGLDWVDGVVVGVETRAQLADNLELFRLPPLTPDQLSEVDEARPQVPAALLDPSTWSD